VPVKAVVFDVGNVLYHWSPKDFYKLLIEDDQELETFMRDVVTMDWHFQHDAGRPFAETSAELIAQFPHYRDLIMAWGSRFSETVTGPVDGMVEIVNALAERGVPVFGITNFADEFWHPFRDKQAAVFNLFTDIVVSGTEKMVKPDDAIYQLALRRFGLSAGQGIFIDDRLENVIAGEANGFVGHHFKSASSLRTHLTALALL
jgi:2-haloacid dehalogenase